MDDAGAASVRAILHWQYRTICRGNNSILYNLYDLLGPKTHDYISFYGLRAYGKLFDGGPVASSQVSSLSAIYLHTHVLCTIPSTSGLIIHVSIPLILFPFSWLLQVYVHSKIMIIDDCTTLIGSANINDRSLLGSRDSEVCLLSRFSTKS